MKIIDRVKKANAKVKKTLNGIKSVTNRVVNWAVENPADAIKIGVSLLTIGGVVRDLRLSGLKDRRIWDPVNGIYWFTKRPLTGFEKLEFEHMVSSGCDRGRALDELGLLNKHR